MPPLQSLIDGAATASSAGRRLDVTNPATGETLYPVEMADAHLTGRAIESARAALPGWAGTPPMRRARILMTFLNKLTDHRDELRDIITREHGKVMNDAAGEVQRGLEVVEYATGAPSLLKGEYTPQVGRGIDAFAQHEPVGVCAGITPFNFPVMVPLWMAPMAIACGNSFVLKPSERDPQAANLMAELFLEAGGPKGVFNVVQGDRDAVDTLLTDSRVNAVSFVGSTPVARHIYATAASHGKRCQALGGAKNHMVVMPDADMDGAANALLGAAYGSAGERCMAISVAVTVGEAGDQLVDRLAPKVRQLRVAPGTDPEADMGPLITRAHRDRVASYVDLGEQEGARLVVDGRGLKLQGYEDGYFLGGSLLDHVTSDMRVYQEEIFGPVLVVVRADDFKQALDLVNSHPYGNGTAIFTRDGGTARSFQQHCNVGMVGVNVPIPVPVAYHSFGGWKDSMFGAHGMHGPDAVQFFTKRKTVTGRWPTESLDAEFTFPVSR